MTSRSVINSGRPALSASSARVRPRDLRKALMSRPTPAWAAPSAEPSNSVAAATRIVGKDLDINPAIAVATRMVRAGS